MLPKTWHGGPWARGQVPHAGAHAKTSSVIEKSTNATTIKHVQINNVLLQNTGIYIYIYIYGFFPASYIYIYGFFPASKS